MGFCCFSLHSASSAYFASKSLDTIPRLSLFSERLALHFILFLFFILLGWWDLVMFLTITAHEGNHLASVYTLVALTKGYRYCWTVVNVESRPCTVVTLRLVSGYVAESKRMQTFHLGTFCSVHLRSILVPCLALTPAVVAAEEDLSGGVVVATYCTVARCACVARSRNPDSNDGWKAS